MYLQPRRAIIKQQRWEREFEKYFQGGCYDNKTKPQSGKSMTCKESSELDYKTIMLYVTCHRLLMLYVTCVICVHVLYMLYVVYVTCYMCTYMYTCYMLLITHYTISLNKTGGKGSQ